MAVEWNANLQVLDETFEEGNEMLRLSDISRYCFFEEIFW